MKIKIDIWSIGHYNPQPKIFKHVKHEGRYIAMLIVRKAKSHLNEHANFNFIYFHCDYNER